MKSKILLGIFILMIMSSGCGKPEGYYYLIASFGKGSEQFLASKDEKFKQVRQTFTLVRRFEHKIWCDGEKETLIKEGVEANCAYDVREYEPAFRGKPVGKWYAMHFIGKLPPTIILYEAFPELPKALALQQLKASLPSILKFVGLDLAPAEVRFFSPAGEVGNTTDSPQT